MAGVTLTDMQRLDVLERAWGAVSAMAFSGLVEGKPVRGPLIPVACGTAVAKAHRDYAESMLPRPSHPSRYDRKGLHRE
jgi:hypothetical protein